MTTWQARLVAEIGRLQVDVQLGGDARPVALIGPNGSGKTTVLRLLAGALPASTARIQVGSDVIANTDEGVDIGIGERRFGYVPQGYGLFPHLSVLDNVAFGLSTGPNRLDRTSGRQRASAILDELRCGGLAERRIAGLSGGEQQRVALARAMVMKPRLLLLDEPLAALDATTRRSVRRFLAQRLADYAIPTLLVTHDVRDVQALDARVVVMDDGNIVQTGTLSDLASAPVNAFVAEFVGISAPSDATQNL